MFWRDGTLKCEHVVKVGEAWVYRQALPGVVSVVPASHLLLHCPAHQYRRAYSAVISCSVITGAGQSVAAGIEVLNC